MTSTDTQGISDEQLIEHLHARGWSLDKIDVAMIREGAAALQADALAAIKAAQEDARRLDWIARQDLDDIVFGVVVDAPHDGEYVVNAGRGPFYGKTFRAAIDKAMEEAR